MILVIMGVCGSGKTTVGEALSAKLKWSFRDADSFHSEENKQKMSKGQPLTDQDRYPWLCSIHDHMAVLIKNKESGIVTCSALKKEYRKILLIGSAAVKQHDDAISKGIHNTDVNKLTVQTDESKSSPITGSISSSATCEKYRKVVLPTEVSLPSPVKPENLIGQVLFIHLTGTEKLLTERLTLRKDHFMPASLLRSQLETLEEMDTTENGFTVSVDKPVDLLVQDIIMRLEPVLVQDS
ncbi:hypothetical protein CHS0354_022285 [Potamilus streckersoni]|uniref:gluconokinase n=1 Tax=Potamilus streckersoni TaxID=2493646 RepID=A0AAE0WD23_9BIVA|nr:hypothetical protein CHS0354_022285 [Potamilus streckersoni]